MRWYVDGMNVIGTRPDGWWRDRDAAMTHLVDLLERWAATEGEDVVVVFFAVPAQLHPSAQSRMQGQQHLTAGVVEHQRRRGDVPRRALATAGRWCWRCGMSGLMR